MQALSFIGGPNHGGYHANGAIPHTAHVEVVELEGVFQATGVTEQSEMLQTVQPAGADGLWALFRSD